jgi:hypothetical protein
LPALAAFAAFLALEMADFCAFPPPIVDVEERRERETVEKEKRFEWKLEAADGRKENSVDSRKKSSSELLGLTCLSLPFAAKGCRAFKPRSLRLHA